MKKAEKERKILTVGLLFVPSIKRLLRNAAFEYPEAELEFEIKKGIFSSDFLITINKNYSESLTEQINEIKKAIS